MPAPGRPALSHDAGLVIGQVTISVGERRVFSHPALAVGDVYRGIHAEEGVSVTQTCAPLGALSLYLVDSPDGIYALIATSVVA